VTDDQDPRIPQPNGTPPLGGEEPDAVSRQNAQTMRNMYVGLRWVGFTEDQAMQLVGTALSTAIGTYRPKDS